MILYDERDTAIERKASDYTLDVFAVVLVVGVSRQRINAIEHGRYDPSLELVFKLARHYECAIEALVDKLSLSRESVGFDDDSGVFAESPLVRIGAARTPEGRPVDTG